MPASASRSPSGDFRRPRTAAASTRLWPMAQTISPGTPQSRIVPKSSCIGARVQVLGASAGEGATNRATNLPSAPAHS